MHHYKEGICRTNVKVHGLIEDFDEFGYDHGPEKGRRGEEEKA